MAKRFRGEGTYKLDDKGRLLLPPAIRSVLQGADGKIPQDDKPTLVIVYGSEEQRHLEIYTEGSMDELAEKIDALDECATKWEAGDLYFGRTEPVDVDSAGRILLKSKFRDKLGSCDDGIYVIGLGSKFEIWLKEDFDADRAAKRADPNGGTSQTARILREIDAQLKLQRREAEHG